MRMSPASRNCFSSQSSSRPQRANRKRPRRPAPSLSTQLMAAAASPWGRGEGKMQGRRTRVWVWGGIVWARGKHMVWEEQESGEQSRYRDNKKQREGAPS
jgi:hypothetical protein